ncbi:MAG TPA: hypothetical protein VK324_15545 [Tepidisphaeraceae bacterium]|nr:hypothetical protein [Tepidisphaeraceae bacterium]
MAKPNLKAATDAFLRELSQATGRSLGELAPLAPRYVEDAAAMRAEGATDEDMQVLADTLFGELQVKGIRFVTGMAQGGRVALNILLAAARAGIGV